MRKLVIVIAIVLFCYSCKDEELPTTYQIFNSTTPVVTPVEYLDGTVYEVFVYHYSKTKIIRQDSVGEIPTGGGKSRLMDVPSNTDLIKVSFKLLPFRAPDYNDPWNVRFYMYDYKIIERGTNNIIGINGGTYISDTIVKAENHVDLFKVVRTLKKSQIK